MAKRRNLLKKPGLEAANWWDKDLSASVFLCVLLGAIVLQEVDVDGTKPS